MTCSRRAPQRGVELVVRWAPDAPHRLIGDPGRIRQILLNLAGNAIVHSAGHVIVAVDAPRSARRTPLLRIRVRDTGIGIAPDKLPSLFAPLPAGRHEHDAPFGGRGSASRSRASSPMGGSWAAHHRLEP